MFFEAKLKNAHYQHNKIKEFHRAKCLNVSGDTVLLGSGTSCMDEHRYTHI